MTDIHYSYTATEAPKQLGIHMNLMRRMNADIKASTMSTLPSMESIFTEAQESVENILRTAVYPRFVKYQMTNSASKALSTDRTRYQGLGDCFCLTDPNKADNPIVFASDGFVSVTGYSRPEVVPRNCRFLQGNYTDRTATKRLKASIEAREETVELLLNYKKTGEPFWNLLYVGMPPCDLSFVAGIFRSAYMKNQHHCSMPKVTWISSSVVKSTARRPSAATPMF